MILFVLLGHLWRVLLCWLLASSRPGSWCRIFFSWLALSCARPPVYPRSALCDSVFHYYGTMVLRYYGTLWYCRVVLPPFAVLGPILIGGSQHTTSLNGGLSFSHGVLDYNFERAERGHVVVWKIAACPPVT